MGPPRKQAAALICHSDSAETGERVHCYYWAAGFVAVLEALRSTESALKLSPDHHSSVQKADLFFLSSTYAYHSDETNINSVVLIEPSTLAMQNTRTDRQCSGPVLLPEAQRAIFRSRLA